MKICVIAAEERRDRKKYIPRPLCKGGHDVCALNTRPFGRFICRVVNVLVNDSPEVVVIIGTGPKELLALFLVRLLGIPFLVRLGGYTLNRDKI